MARRDTAPRRAILEAFSTLTGHVPLVDLVRAVHALDDSVGQSTIYRNLRLLIEQGQVVERHFEGRATCYERVRRAEHHDHLICSSCGAIVEFMDPKIEELQAEVAARHGFEVRSHLHELYGVCRTCRLHPPKPDG